MKTLFLVTVDIDPTDPNNLEDSSWDDLVLNLKCEPITIRDLLEHREFSEALRSLGWYNKNEAESISEAVHYGDRAFLIKNYGSGSIYGTEVNINKLSNSHIEQIANGDCLAQEITPKLLSEKIEARRKKLQEQKQLAAEAECKRAAKKAEEKRKREIEKAKKLLESEGL